MKIWLVYCTKCGNKQQIITHKGKNPYGRIRRCVYCGKNFVINVKNLIKKVY